MRIAFTSCFSAQSFKKQPVWDQIGALDPAPAHLVLLGDAAYYDGDGSSMTAVQLMSAHEFAMHAMDRLRDQLNQRQFAKLFRRHGLRIHPIWDDRDFLWNDACGAQIAQQPPLSDYIPATRAVFQLFRDALDAHDPTTFPGPGYPWRRTSQSPATG